MRDGLHDLSGSPHQLAGAVLDGLVDEIVSPPSFALTGPEEARERVRQSVGQACRLALVGATTGARRSPDDVRAILDLMVPFDLPLADVVAEKAPDLFGAARRMEPAIDVVVRNRAGRPWCLASGAYWDLFEAEKPLRSFARSCAVAADLTAGRFRREDRCVAVLGIVAAHFDDGPAQDLAECVSLLLRREERRMADRTALFASRLIAAGSRRCWSRGAPPETFAALVLLFDPG